MTHTPDEIKKGIKCCHINDVDLCDCESCPYAHKGWQTAGCDITMAGDALALIQQQERVIKNMAEVNAGLNRKRDALKNRNQQLQAENAQQARCIENMTDKLNAMNDEVAKLQAERDAAVADIRLAFTSYVGACQTCKHCKNQVDCDEQEACGMCKIENCPCRTCGQEDRNWEWRGVQKEGSDDGKE